MPRFEFPDHVFGMLELVNITFPNGKTSEALVRGRTKLPDGQIQIHLWGRNDFDPYGHTLFLRDDEWFATILGSGTTHKVEIEISED